MNAPEVQVEQGRLSGAPIENGVRRYLGIPYAAPPVGGRRWRAPEAPVSWTGVRAAEHFGARCVQKPMFSDMVFRSSCTSEDCLFLNVWTGAHDAGERLPVLVYFHGGAMVAGEGAEPRYDGTSLAARGLVVVTVNYRLGLLGFLAHAELTAESPQQASGMYGLLDQVAALGWVQRNIAAFGGDPRRVTVGGESAGSMSVSALMVSPLSRAMIAGAIGESGSMLGFNWSSLAEGEALGQTLATAAGCRSLKQLRALPVEKLLELGSGPEMQGLRFVVDGYFVPQSPHRLYAAGEQAPVPLLAGSNNPEVRAEFMLRGRPLTLESYVSEVRRLYGAHAEAVLQHYPATDDASLRRAADTLASDRFIGQGTWKWVQESARRGPEQTWYYRFDKPRPAASDGKLPADTGTVHAGEIEYALGNLASNAVYAWTPDDADVSHTMQGYFVNFIRTGNPNGPGLPDWPSYSTGKLMAINVDSHAEEDSARERRRFMDRLQQATANIGPLELHRGYASMPRGTR